MRKIVMGLVLALGVMGSASTGAGAATNVAGLTAAPSHRSDIVEAGYYYNHRHWEHRHYEHGHWHYY